MQKKLSGEAIMEIEIRAINADELNFHTNPIQFQPNARIEMTPQFSRQIKKIGEKIYLCNLKMTILSTDEAPKPFDITISYNGVFATADPQTDDEKRQLAVFATSTIYPYIKNALTLLTCTAQVATLNLPPIPPTMPGDKPEYVLKVDESLMS